VERTEGSKILTTVIQEGILYNNKGVNLRGGGLSARALTDKDKEDILIAAKAEADYVALSFPVSADDVRETKKLLKDRDKSDLSISGKENLEKRLAKKKGVIAKIAKRILPKIRSAENERLAKRRGSE